MEKHTKSIIGGPRTPGPESYLDVLPTISHADHVLVLAMRIFQALHPMRLVFRSCGPLPADQYRPLVTLGSEEVHESHRGGAITTRLSSWTYLSVKVVHFLAGSVMNPCGYFTGAVEFGNVMMWWA